MAKEVIQSKFPTKVISTEEEEQMVPHPAEFRPASSVLAGIAKELKYLHNDATQLQSHLAPLVRSAASGSVDSTDFQSLDRMTQYLGALSEMTLMISEEIGDRPIQIQTLRGHRPLASVLEAVLADPHAELDERRYDIDLF